MQDPPGPVQLLAAVLGVLQQPDDARSQLDSRIAASVLAIVRRQLEIAPAADAEELGSLRQILRLNSNDLLALNVELCARIADGRIVASSAELVRHLWTTTLAKLAVDQPGYSTFLLHAAFDRAPPKASS